MAIVWVLSFEYVDYSQTALDSSSAGSAAELPSGLLFWEWVVAITTIVGACGIVFDFLAVRRAQKSQTKTILQARSHVTNDLVRAKQNSPLGPYFYDRPLWFSDGRVHEITKDAIGHASKDQAFEQKQRDSYKRVTHKWSPEPEKSTTSSEERKYIGPEEFTQRLTFRLTFYQWMTIIRTVFVLTHFAQVTFYNDGRENWYGMMSLGLCAPFIHIQYFEWACGHKGNGHLIIVIERALRKDIKTFLIVLGVFILGFGQALYILAVDTVNDPSESSGDVARIFRSWLSLFRIATGEKPGWAKQDRDWDTLPGRDSEMHQDLEQAYIYLLFFAFVIIAAIVLLRLLVRVANLIAGSVTAT